VALSFCNGATSLCNGSSLLRNGATSLCNGTNSPMFISPPSLPAALSPILGSSRTRSSGTSGLDILEHGRDLATQRSHLVPGHSRSTGKHYRELDVLLQNVKDP
jgi:hypothetical protein